MIDLLALLLIVLLPVAAVTGWITRDNLLKKSRVVQSNQLSASYFKGINFLLNEEPDKALGEFLKIANLKTNDAIEVHLALGNLFRKRGEVDRAIRIHQNIISRDALTDIQRLTALIELAEDYMSAGLLDRAEKLYIKIIENNHYNTQQALQKLLIIYQQEQDWLQAISTAKLLEEKYEVKLCNVIGHFYCELAENKLNAKDKTDDVIEMIRMALQHDASCVRAHIISGLLHEKNQNFSDAIHAYETALAIDITFIPLLLEMIVDCYQKLGKEKDMQIFLQQLVEKYDGITATLKLAHYLADSSDEKIALAFMNEKLSIRPSIKGLDYIIELNLRQSKGSSKNILIMLQQHIKKILEDKSIFRCDYCGFSSQTHHWQCPSCKSWDTTKPIRGVTAE